MTNGLNEITAIVERMAINKRSEESPRLFILLSTPVHGAEQILSALAGQLKNPVNLTFEVLQPPLSRASADPSADPEETEEVEMSVDGQDGQKVRRPRSNGHVQVDEPYGNLEKAAGEQLSDAAAKLISDSRTTPATETEAQEQAEAEARLAQRG